MTRLLQAVAFVLTVAVTASIAGAQSAVVYGTLLRDSIGHPLANATIEIAKLDRAVRSDSLGNFKFERLPAGPVDLTIRHIGFNRLDDHLDLTDGATYLEQYVVEEWPVILDKVNVNATTKKWISSELNDFEDRRKTHLGGYFLGDEELRATSDRSMQTLLSSSMPSLRAYKTFFTNARFTIPCMPTLYVDGIRLQMSPMPDFTSEDPANYSGVEYYPGAASIPARFNSTSAGCGVLLLWSRAKIGP